MYSLVRTGNISLVILWDEPYHPPLLLLIASSSSQYWPWHMPWSDHWSNMVSCYRSWRVSKTLRALWRAILTAMSLSTIMKWDWSYGKISTCTWSVIGLTNFWHWSHWIAHWCNKILMCNLLHVVVKFFNGGEIYRETSDDHKWHLHIKWPLWKMH